MRLGGGVLLVFVLGLGVLRGSGGAKTLWKDAEGLSVRVGGGAHGSSRGGGVLSSSEKLAEIEPAIVNGDVVTDPEKYPWIVYMARNEDTAESFCTASIVADQLVLIAAHCVLTIGSGELSLYSVCRGIDSDFGDCYGVEAIDVHPDFDINQPQEGNDLAIVKTSSSMLQNGATIVKISTLPPINLQETWTVGYGITNNRNDDRTVLREVDTVFVDPQACLTMNSLNALELPNDPNKLACADGHHDNSEGGACNGDSGSPLLVMSDQIENSYSLGAASFVLRLENGKCSTYFESVYSSTWDDDHLNYLLETAEELGGELTLAESDLCQREAYSQCLSQYPLSCVQNAPGASCCETVQNALDCITPLADECENQGLIDAIPVVGGSLLGLCLDGLPERDDSQLFADNDASCFPGSAFAVMENGDQKLMRDLEVGDRVMVQGGSFSDVYAFGHHDTERRQEFVRLECGDHGAIELSGNHYLVSENDLVLAGAIEIGSILQLGNGDRVKVSGKSSVKRVGVYNPHTLDGTIVVNGIVASTYTRAVHPKLAEILLGIPRAMYKLGMKNPLGSLMHYSTPEWIRHWIPKGSSTVLM